jgi:hypothetical protein
MTTLIIRKHTRVQQHINMTTTLQSSANSNLKLENPKGGIQKKKGAHKPAMSKKWVFILDWGNGSDDSSQSGTDEALGCFKSCIKITGVVWLLGRATSTTNSSPSASVGKPEGLQFRGYVAMAALKSKKQMANLISEDYREHCEWSPMTAHQIPGVASGKAPSQEQIESFLMGGASAATLVCGPWNHGKFGGGGRPFKNNGHESELGGSENTIKIKPRQAMEMVEEGWQIDEFKQAATNKNKHKESARCRRCPLVQVSPPQAPKCQRSSKLASLAQRVSPKSFVEFIAKVAAEGHHWPEVEDFAKDADGDAQWEGVTSASSMKAQIVKNGWMPANTNVGEAAIVAMNTWCAFTMAMKAGPQCGARHQS